MKHRLDFYLITLLSTALFLFLQLTDPPVIREHIESKTYDLRLILRNRLLGQKSPPGNIVIVAIDEKSLREIGRWPWRRDRMARLVALLSAGGPAVIGIDVMFTEPESPESDGALAAAIRRAGNVVLATPFFLTRQDAEKKESPETSDLLWDAAFMKVKSVPGIRWKDNAVTTVDVITPLPQLAKKAALGHVYADMDMDGVIRWEPLYIRYADDCYPQFSLQVCRIALGIGMKEMTVFGGSGVAIGSRFIPTDLSGRVLINYIGGEQSFNYVSASDVITGRVVPQVFSGKIVLVGTSALATHDQKVTPFSVDMPGVEKNANVVWNILRNDFLRQSPRIIEVVALVLTGLFFGIFLPRLKALPSALLAAAFIVAYIGLSCALLFYKGLVISLVYPLANMTGIFAVQTVMRFVFEEQKARDIRRVFSNYVSPKIVKELIEHPEKTRLSGERRDVTILFADVIGFASLSERRPPEEVVAMLNEYFSRMTEIIFKWDGTLDKFVGDEIMVFWGAPADQANHAELAVRCALDMSERLNEMQAEWHRKGVEGLDCGISINTGEVLIGNIGSPGRKMDYTIIGDHVNLAARVEKLTRQYHCRILITEHTALRMESALREGRFGHIALHEVDSVHVKGKVQAVRILRLSGLPHS
jgi:adenylate cyclase